LLPFSIGLEKCWKRVKFFLTPDCICVIVIKRVESTPQQAEYPLSPYGDRAGKRYFFNCFAQGDFVCFVERV